MATGEGQPDAEARFRPEGQHELGPSGQVARITANITAIKALHRIQDEGRPATLSEQAFLARWSGWGAVPGVFDEARDQFADARAELRSLLSEEEWAAARRTTMNAHYTDAAIVKAMWDAVTGLGFDGGVVLEPGCGSGNFIGFAPASARMLGVELDPVTAGIAAALYPDAEVRNESFADSRLPEGGFDLVVGNVPFSSAILTDPRHNQGRHSMHNHFLVKSLALTRPGGLVVALTSRYTMDAQDDAARREMAGMADLVTAVRLPSGAHRKAAGTEAVTDLMVFRRREEGQPRRGADWERAFATELDGGTARVGEYFKDHPENVLGHLAVDGGQYSSEELIVRPRDLALVPAELADRLGMERMDAQAAGLVMSPRGPAQKMAEVRAGAGRVSLRIVAREASRFEGTITADPVAGTFTVLRNGDAEPWPCPASQQAELRALLRLRDAVAALLDAEKASADDTPRIGELRSRLNRDYDAYQATHGPLNRMSWRRTGRTDGDGNETWSRQVPAQGGFRTDPYAAIVYALEDYDPETGTAAKAAIFTQRVISPREPATSAETPADAIAICMDADGEIRLEQVASLLGLESQDEARAALGELAYDHPGTGRLVPAPEYLSGKVRDKLAEAEKAAKGDPRFAVNVAALRRALPADLGPGDIDARLGASWIPPALVQQGLREILADPRLTVTKGHGTTWSVSGTQDSVLAREVYGTSDKDAISLAQALLEQRPIKVSYSMDDLDREDRARLDAIRDRRDMQAFIRARSAAATITARAKADELSEKFTEWLWTDPARSAELTSLYNKRFNSLVLRSYDDVRPRLPGLAGWFRPHPHQYAAVARIISEPAALLAHEVGAGKTAEMAMGAMELRRLGLVAKPAIVVPNHMLEQFQREFLQLYPQAKVLACGARDLEAGRRHAFVARIATGDWDAVIMSRSVFERIPMSASEQQRYIRNKLKAYDEWLERAAEETDNPRMVKRMESQRLSFEERLKRKLVKTRDAGISFEQTGIDYLFIDEAHGYKNLDTRSNNPSLDIDGSGRASDLEMKVDYLRRGRGKRVCTFATATPIANSMTEAYVMTRYLRPDLLADAGIEDFDGWVGSFASTVTDVEVAPEGGLRVKERVASFRNVPELLLMWRVFADVKTAADLKLPVPELAGGKPEVVTVPPSAELKHFMLSLASRAEEVRRGSVDPKEDNMLKISSDGRAAALDLRLIGRRAPINGKLDAAADRIASIYEGTRDSVYVDSDGNPEPRRGALQIVFCELGTPTGTSMFGTYEYLRGQLAARGVPAAQVRFMHEARNDKEKAQLFADARAGKISVLIGTTELMGVGTNVQKRAVALHHLDCPWRPADVAQREGRIIRQKNQNPRVQVIRYVTEGSFDAYMWQTVLRKAKFIAQIMRGSVDSREIEDIGGSDPLSYSEVTALATGDMRILAKAKADADVVRLSRLESSWRRSQRHLKESIGQNERHITYTQVSLTGLEAAIARRTDTRGDAFHCQLGGRVITKRADAAAILQEAARELLATAQQSWMLTAGEDTVERETRDLGVVGGLRLQATANCLEDSSGWVDFRFPDIPGSLVMIGSAEADSEKAPIGVVYKLENTLASLDGAADDARAEIAHAQAEIERARAALGTPFSKAAELSHARSEADRLAAELGGQRVVPMPEPEAHETPATDAQAAQEDQAETVAPASDLEAGTPEASASQQEAGDAEPGEHDEEAGEDGTSGEDGWAAPAAQVAPAPASAPAVTSLGLDGQASMPSLREIADAMGDRFQIIPVGFSSGKAAVEQDRTPPEAPLPASQPVAAPAAAAPARASTEQPATAVPAPEAAGPTVSAVANPEEPGNQQPPGGSWPLAALQRWGGALRPERPLYPDGTRLAVRGAGDDGSGWRPGTAAGCIGSADRDHGGGLLQVVRWDDGSYETIHPALECMQGIDPYAGLSDRDRERWQRLDRHEALGVPVAYLPASLVEPGDTIQAERGLLSRVLDQHEVTAVREDATGQRPVTEITVAGKRRPLSFRADDQVGVYLQQDHPTLAATIEAATAALQGRPQSPRDHPSVRPTAPVAAPAAQPAPVPAAGARRPTAEQQAIIDACVSGQNLVIEAGAGTGKTSTLRMASAAMTGRTGLYVAYNKAIANEARGSFPANVTCATAHSLAFQAIGRSYARRLNSKRLPAHEIAALLGIREPMQLGEEMLTPPQLAGIVMGTVGRFCHSADHAISSAHVPPVNGAAGLRRAQLTQFIVPLAASAWTDLQRSDGRLPFSHDHYLKMWQLTQPRLNAGFVLFDEAQDADPVIAAIIQGQDGAQKIAVGDSCQAIYGWRGAVDALATWPADQRLYLSQSFRFGVPIAEEANKWLENLGAVLRLKGTPSITSAIGTVTTPDAVLCRTNAEAVSQSLALLEQGRRVALVGGGDDIKRLAEAARELQQRGHTSHPELAAFRTWSAVQRYVRDDEGGADLATFVRLVDAHGPEAVIRTIDQLSSEDTADVVVSTAHKAKGREWNQVLIAPDFREPANDKDTGQRGVIPRADAMLAYVAVTRAKERLDRGSLAWIDNYASGAPTPGQDSAATADREQARIAASDVGIRHPVSAASHEPADHQSAAQVPVASSPEGSTVADEPEAAQGQPIRIEHDARGTRVFGTAKSQLDVIGALKDQGFKWSRNQGFWYLNSTWKQSTRGVRVQALQRRLDQLGVPYSPAPGTPQETSPAAGPSAQASLAAAPGGTQLRASGETATADPVTAPDIADVAPTAASYEQAPDTLAEDAPAQGAGDAPTDAAGSAGTEYEQASLFGLPAPKPQNEKSHPRQSALQPGSVGEARIDHSPTDTSVHGVDRSNPAAAKLFRAFYLVWSEDQLCWHLGAGRRGDHDTWALLLAMRLEGLGYRVTWEGSRRPRPAPEASESASITTGPAAEGPATQPTVADTATIASTQAEISNETAGEVQGVPAVTEPGQGKEAPPTAATASTAISDSLASIPVDPRPYEGSRAQAMSGSLIIENDHRAWASARALAGDASLPDEHPRVRQFSIAWQRVAAKGLDDGPGPAAARYHALAHAALALSSSIDRTSNPHEPEALDLLANHARKHSVRLRATAERLFSGSRQAGRYQGGRAQAETGSRVIERDYRAWIRTGSPLEAARDPLLWQHARRAEKAWHLVRRHGVTDGPAAAATRYRELADAAQALADRYTVTLPSSALPPLLDLAEHAWKHSTRLQATARAASAGGGSVPTSEDERDVPRGGDAYGALPDGLAAVTRQAHADQYQQPQRPARMSDDYMPNRNAATPQYSSHKEDSRELAPLLLRQIPA
jgi:N12 class adenine-specific DNA methylase